MRSLVRLILVGIFILLPLLQTSAQTPLSILIGKVTDSRGRGVRGARVVLLYNNKISVGEETTNARGEFRFDSLRPGNYNVAVEAQGLTQSGGSQPVKIMGGTQHVLSIALTVAALKDALIVSATRTESLLGETASSAYVVPAANLMRAQSVNVSDALRFTPGVTVIQTGRRGGLTSLFVRGGEADYTKVLIDGVPVNDAGGSFNFADLTTDNTERIELVRGTQSSIYGSDAMSGVLQILTQRGNTPKPEFEFFGEGGSFRFNRQFTRLSGERGPMDYSLSYSHLATDGRDFNDRYENRVLTTNLGYRFNEGRSLRLTVRKDNSGMGIPGPTAVLFPDPDENGRRGRTALGARFDDQTTNLWHQSLAFAYSESKSLNFDPVAQDLTNSSTPALQMPWGIDSAFYFNNYQRRRGLRYQSDMVFRRRHFISTGVDYEEERAVFDSGFSNVLHVDAERRNVGTFVQDQFQYGPRIFITAGLRLENNNATVPSNFNLSLIDLGSIPYTGKAGYGMEVLPKVSAIYVLRLGSLQSRAGSTRLKFNYGHGIKAPQLMESFGPDQLFALGNPALKPERSRSFDIGLEQYFFKDSIRVEGFYFENRFRDQIAYVADPMTMGGPIRLMDGRLTHFINFDRTLARGFEMGLAWHPKRWLEFGQSYTLLDTDLLAATDVFDRMTNQQVSNPEIGLPLLRRPRNSGTVSAAFTTDNFTLSMIGAFIGKRRDRDPVTSSLFDQSGSPIYNSRYQRVDMAGSYRLNSWMNLYGRIENLLNQDYQEVLGYPAYRLNFSAGMKFRIGGGR